MAVGEWDQRQLCSDGACIGVIGPDGRCKVCGRRASGASAEAPSSEPAVPPTPDAPAAAPTAAVSTAAVSTAPTSPPDHAPGSDPHFATANGLGCIPGQPMVKPSQRTPRGSRCRSHSGRRA